MHKAMYLLQLRVFFPVEYTLFKAKVFPYADRQVPKKYVCQGFGFEHSGWGPMLTTAMWEYLCFHNDLGRKGYLCEKCMETYLERPLETCDLRDCPMNYHHPKYRRTGAF